MNILPYLSVGFNLHKVHFALKIHLLDLSNQQASSGISVGGSYGG